MYVDISGAIQVEAANGSSQHKNDAKISLLKKASAVCW